MSLTHWLVVAVLLLLLFGRGKISELMGDMAKGIKSFKKGLAEEDEPAEAPAEPARTIEHQPAEPVAIAPAAAAPARVKRAPAKRTTAAKKPASRAKAKT